MSKGNFETGPKLEPYLREKRKELMWALAKQGYNAAQVSRIFSGITRGRAHTIISEMPEDWSSPWKKDNK